MDATVSQCVIRVRDPATSFRRVGERCLLGWQMREFTRYGVTDFLLLGDRMLTDVELALPRPAAISLLQTPVGAPAESALLAARDQLQDRFLFSDLATPFVWNLGALLADAATGDPQLIGWLAEPWGTARIAVFRKALLGHLHLGCPLAAGLLELARHGQVVSRCTAGAATAVIAPDTVRLRRKALFLDRDGVLNIDHGYVGSRDRFEWVDGALEAIRYATEAGWHVFIVTNQSGVARGQYTEDAVRRLLDWIGEQARKAGGTIDDVRFCPYHPEAELDAYRQTHPWRKPLPGMLLDLIRAWELDPGQAVMVGDQETDMAAAAAAGMAGYLFAGGNLLSFIRPILDQPHPGPARRAALTLS
jgi:D,D-heptose 1,7-bisphosphate phosphatase